MWTLNLISLNNQWAKEEITKETIEYFEINENVDIAYQNGWDADKVVFRGKFITVNTYIKKDSNQ